MRLAFASALVAGLSVLAPAVSAQELADASSAQPAVELDAVVVTGEKIQREEIETTTSVGLRNGRQVDESAAQTVEQVISQMANVGTANGLTIRGIPLYGPTVGDSKVATVSVDGVSQEGYSQGIDELSSWDLDRIEVLRGPQSTNQGRNALAGAVVLRSNDPTNDWDGRALVSAGNQNGRRIAVAGGGPIIADLAAFRLSFDRNDLDGASYNETLDDHQWAHDYQQTLRAKLLLTPGSEFYRALVTLVDQRMDEGDRYVEASLRDIDERISLANEPTRYTPKSRSAALEQTLHWEHVELSFLSTWLDSKSHNVSDYDGTEFDLGESYSRSDQDMFTQEIRSNLSLPLFGRKVEGVVGVYYSDQDMRSRYGYSLPLYYGLYATGLCGAALGDPAASLETCEAVFSADPEHLVLRDDDNRSEVGNRAAYFEFDVPFGAFTLTAGLRYDREERTEDLSNDTTGNDAYTQALLTSVGFGPEEALGLKNTYSAWLPKLGLRYALSPRWVAGLSWQRGYRAGGTSYSYLPSSIGGGSHPYDPEFTSNYELSIKGKPTRRTMLGFNAYRIDWSDQQVNIGTSSLDTHIVNAGRSRLQGLELEGRGFLRQDLEVFAALGLSRTEYREFEVPASGADYSGNEFLRSPRTTASTGLSWKPGNWTINADVVFEGGTYSSADNDPELRNDGHTVFNSRIAYALPHGLSVFAYGLNLFDDTYSTWTFQTVAGRSSSYLGDARVFGAGLEWRM